MKAIRDNTILKREPKPAGLYTDKRPKTNIQKKQNLYFFIIFILLFILLYWCGSHVYAYEKKYYNNTR